MALNEGNRIVIMGSGMLTLVHNDRNEQVKSVSLSKVEYKLLCRIFFLLWGHSKVLNCCDKEACGLIIIPVTVMKPVD